MGIEVAITKCMEGRCLICGFSDLTVMVEEFKNTFIEFTFCNSCGHDFVPKEQELRNEKRVKASRTDHWFNYTKTQTKE